MWNHSEIKLQSAKPSPASPDVWLMCAELMLAELTMLLLAGLNSFSGSDIIEYKLDGKSPIFHIPFSKLASIANGKVSNRSVRSKNASAMP